MTLMAPRDEKSMHEALQYSYTHKGPLAIRYPRGSFIDDASFESIPFVYGKGQILKEAKTSIALLGYGSGVGKAIEVARLLEEDGIDVALIDLRFVKPLDEALLQDVATRYAQWYVISESAKIGGVGSLLQMMKEEKDLHVKIKSFEYDDHFITHGATPLIEKRLGIHTEQLSEYIKKEFIN